MNCVKAEDAVKELSLLLMYLTRFRDKDYPVDWAWKNYDFDAVDKLDEEGYIDRGSFKSKSVMITKKGLQFAQELLKKYQIEES